MFGLGGHLAYIRGKVKSKDLQTAVKNKYENGDGSTKIYRDLCGVVSLRTVKLWIRMINNTGSINLSYSSGHPHTARTTTDWFTKKKRIKFANWMLNHYKKEDTKRWLSTEEKYFLI